MIIYRADYRFDGESRHCTRRRHGSDATALRVSRAERLLMISNAAHANGARLLQSVGIIVVFSPGSIMPISSLAMARLSKDYFNGSPLCSEKIDHRDDAVSWQASTIWQKILLHKSRYDVATASHQRRQVLRKTLRIASSKICMIARYYRRSSPEDRLSICRGKE